MQSMNDRWTQLGEELGWAIVEDLPVGVVCLDTDGQVLYANPFFESLVGRSLSTYGGGEWLSEFLPMSDSEQIREIFRDLLEGASSTQTFSAVLTTSDKEREIDWSVRIRPSGGQQVLVCTGTERTSEQREEHERRRVEQRLTDLFQNSLDLQALYVVDGDEFRVIVMNQQFREILARCSDADSVRSLEAMTRRELLGNLHVPQALIDEDLANFRKVAATETPMRFRQHCNIRGKDTHAEVLLTPIRDPESAEIQLLWTSRDVTASWEAQEALRTSQALLIESQRLASLGSWELDLQSGTLNWSDEVYRMFGLEKTEFGASYEAFLQAVHPEDRDLVDTAYKKSLVDKKPYEVTHRLLREDGHVSYVVERCMSEFDEAGQPIRSMGTVQDVTKLQNSEVELRNSLREKDTLLREMHHRVKNNLQIISSLLHFQAKRVASAEDRKAFDEGRQRLLAMVLVHEKLYQSKELSNIDFGDYIRSLVGSLLESSSRSGRIEIGLELDEVSLPIESALPCGMIVCELLMNLFKYAYPEGEEGSAVVEVAVDGAMVEVVVADRGAGFPADFTVANAKTFGWQLVRNLVVQLDGDVTTTSENGTRVVVRFPWRAEDHSMRARSVGSL